MHKYKRVLLNNCLTADALDIDLSVLGYTFETKPLLIGGKAKGITGLEKQAQILTLSLLRVITNCCRLSTQVISKKYGETLEFTNMGSKYGRVFAC